MIIIYLYKYKKIKLFKIIYLIYIKFLNNIII